MRRTARWLAALGALCVAQPLAAQTPPAEPNTTPDRPADQPASDPGIVVTGKPTQAASGSEVFEQARGISRVGPHDLYEEALPRFWEPVCPGVSGLQTDYAEVMIDRMRDTITRLKVPLAKEGCSPNLIVAFEKDGRSLLSDLERNRPDIFQLVSQSEQSELLAGQAPVRVWNNIAKRWTGSGAPPRDEDKASVWGQLDRNNMPWSFDIVGALVVFERGAVEGMTLTQLADYATMRGLSHTRPAKGGQPMATILSLFDGDNASPGELTDFDVGYLRSLYSWKPSASAAHKLLDVQRWADKAAGDAARK